MECTKCGRVVKFGKHRKVKQPFVCRWCTKASEKKQGEVKSFTKKRKYFKGDNVEATKSDIELPEVQESDNTADPEF